MALAGPCRSLIVFTLGLWIAPQLEAIRANLFFPTQCSDCVEENIESDVEEPKSPRFVEAEPPGDQRDLLIYFVGKRAYTFRSFVQRLVDANGQDAFPIYMFDFDDTLLPTTWLQLWRGDASNLTLTNTTVSLVVEGINSVRRLVEEASRRGTVLIVTNAGVGWLTKAVVELANLGVCQEEDYAWMDAFPVIYAPEYYMQLTGVRKLDPSASRFFKKAVVAEVYGQFTDAGVILTKWFSIGDSTNDLVVHSGELTTDKFWHQGSEAGFGEQRGTGQPAPRVRTSSWKLQSLRKFQDPGGVLPVWTAQMRELAENAGEVLTFGDTDIHKLVQVDPSLP